MLSGREGQLRSLTRATQHGRALTGPSHNYNRHGTTMLFAALATGKLVKASLREHIDVFNASYNETAKPFVWNNFKVHQKQDVSAIYDSGH
jgi:hypothetical protein